MFRMEELDLLILCVAHSASERHPSQRVQPQKGSVISPRSVFSRVLCWEGLEASGEIDS